MTRPFKARFEVYQSPLSITWHWRLVLGAATVARSPEFQRRSVMLQSIDDMVELLSDPSQVDIVELRETPK